MKQAIEIEKKLKQTIRGLVECYQLDSEVFKVSITNGIYIWDKTFTISNENWLKELLTDYSTFIHNMYFYE